MKTILSYSTKQNFSSGRMAQKTFEKTGKIAICFYNTENQIGASIEGIEVSTIYIKNPITEKQKRQNHFFIERYVKPCVNAQELIFLFNF